MGKVNPVTEKSSLTDFKMKVIIAGCRDFNDYELLKAEVNILLLKNRVEEIVSGCATGADTLGERYANENNIRVKRFPANWGEHGKKAGYLRNKQMAEYATHCICFWDGKSKGTEMMINLAEEYNLKTVVIKI